MGPCINCPTQLVDQQLSASLQEIWQRTRQSGPCNLHGAPDKTACTFADGLDVAKQSRTQSKKVLHDSSFKKKTRYNLLNLEFLWFFKGSGFPVGQGRCMGRGAFKSTCIHRRDVWLRADSHSCIKNAIPWNLVNHQKVGKLRKNYHTKKARKIHV